MIAYVQEQDRILKRRLMGKRIRFTDDERRRLAGQGKLLGRNVLREVASIVTPDTIFAWHWKPIAQKWDHSGKRGPGRPRVGEEIAELTVRMAKENPGWGFTTIMEALANLGCEVARGTVSNILKTHGIEPAPERSKRMPWSTFLKAHWNSMAATDLFTEMVFPMPVTIPTMTASTTIPTIVRMTTIGVRATTMTMASATPVMAVPMTQTRVTRALAVCWTWMPTVTAN